MGPGCLLDGGGSFDLFYSFYDGEIMAVNPMRIQATALMTMDEKTVLVEQSEDHKTTQSTILRAGLLAFTSLPRLEQALWITMAEQATAENKQLFT